MKTQVLNVVRSKSFVFLIMAVLSTQLSMAQNLPAHSSTAGCYGPLYDGSYALGAGPTDFQPWPALTT